MREHISFSFRVLLAHDLLFLTVFVDCNDALLKRLAAPNVARYIKTLKELDLTFVPYESRVFTLDLPNAMSQVYVGSPNLQVRLYNIELM